jgi:hypothetical protein
VLDPVGQADPQSGFFSPRRALEPKTPRNAAEGRRRAKVMGAPLSRNGKNRSAHRGI